MIPTNEQMRALNKVKDLLMKRKNELWDEYYKYPNTSLEATVIEQRKSGIMEAIYTIDAMKDGEHDF